MYSPMVMKIEYKLVKMTKEGYMALMDSEGKVREDLKLPEGE